MGSYPLFEKLGLPSQLTKGMKLSKSAKLLPWVADMPEYSLGRSSSDVADENKISSESVVILASNENPYGCSPLSKNF